MLVLKRMSVNDKEGIKELFADVFTKEPWNDDWSDKDQLDLYITDLTGQSISLTYGLYDGDELIAYAEDGDWLLIRTELGGYGWIKNTLVTKK